ncbi:MAG: hypothetical protein ACTSSP_00100 [Candidatus Asgardarchaeia archaeon]
MQLIQKRAGMDGESIKKWFRYWFIEEDKEDEEPEEIEEENWLEILDEIGEKVIEGCNKRFGSKKWWKSVFKFLARIIVWILKLLVNIIYNIVRLISSYAWLTIGAFGGFILFIFVLLVIIEAEGFDSEGGGLLVDAFEGDRSVSSIIGGTIGYCIVPTLLYLFLKSVNF